MYNLLMLYIYTSVTSYLLHIVRFQFLFPFKYRFMEEDRREKDVKITIQNGFENVSRLSEKKPMYLFGVDVSNYSKKSQFLLGTCGIFVLYIAYGYIQVSPWLTYYF